MEFIYDSIFGLKFIGLETSQTTIEMVIEYSKSLGLGISPELMNNNTLIISNY